MNEENQEEQSLGKQIANQAVETGQKVAEQKVKQARAKMLAKVGTWVVANITTILIILAICLVVGVLLAAVDWFLDTYTSESVDKIASDMVGQYCIVDDRGIHFDKEAFLTAIAEELKTGGIDYNSLGLGNDGDPNSNVHDIDIETLKNSQAAQYLYRFMTASLTTEFPYIEGSDEEAQGIVKIKRKKSETEEAKDLTYIGYEKFQNTLKNGNRTQKEQLLNNFSIDESWNLCIVKYYKETVNGNETQYDVIEVKIPYRTMISQYSVPFVFLMNLQIATGNANYVDAVADLITQKSEIEFTIFDSVTTDTQTYTYNATKHIKISTENISNTAAVSGSEYQITTREINEETVTVKEMDTIKANVTKAKTWILDQVTEYVVETQKEYPLGEEGETKSYSDGSEPSGEGTWLDPVTEHWDEEIVKQEWIKSADTKTNFTPSEFLGLWKNATGTYELGAPYDANGKVVSYNLAGGNLKDRPIMNILSAEEQFYGLFEDNAKTQTHAELMRYLIHLYKTGEELDISGLKSLFEPDEFVEGSYLGDFDVHDESLFITDLETLKQAFQGGYSGHEKLVQHAQAFLDIQERYKVNALFAASVSITETSAGRAGHAIDGNNNWFNVRQGNGWRKYDSPEDSIMGFGWQIAEGGFYYTEGNYTVGSIGQVYCPNTPEYPTQADDWVVNTKAQIVRFYAAVGRDANSYMTGGGYGAGGVTGAAGEGYRGKYTTGSGKTYVEYLQYAGPWWSNYYMGGNMKNSGCSVTSTAVILSGFGIDKNPEDVRRINPGGISITGVLNSFGLKTFVSYYNTSNGTEISEHANRVLEHLKSGNPVIINAGNGYWSNGSGHYFAVLEANGNQVYVSNVGSSKKTGWMHINKVLEDNKKVIFVSK